MRCLEQEEDLSCGCVMFPVMLCEEGAYEGLDEGVQGIPRVSLGNISDAFHVS